MQSNTLIIDDDIELCKLLKKYMEKENITADLAHTGTEGLNLASQENYHLIVLDIMLPGMDGFQVLEKIRKMSAVPVLMLTAKTASADKVNGLRSGADDYLTKPFDVDEFTARVLSLIRRYTTLNTGSIEESNRLSFQKCDRARLQKGSGLGLSIVQQLVQKMGGMITVKSEPNRQTEFTIRFLLAAKSPC